MILEYDNLKDYLEAPVQFITFNYDRSLELFLTKALSNTFGAAPDSQEIQSFIETRIIHVHGSLGDLSDIPYEPISSDRIDQGVLDRMANRLRIVSDPDDQDLLQSAREVVRDATKIHILGLSYQPGNIKKIGGDVSKDILPDIKGTCLELSEKEIQRAKATIKAEIGFGSILLPIDCSEYITQGHCHDFCHDRAEHHRGRTRRR